MSHTTRFGTKHTDQEWKELNEIFNREYKEAVDYLDRQDAMLRHAAKMLEDAGVTGNTFGIADHIFNYGLDGIEFSSSEKAEAVEKIADWIEDRTKEL